jgi:hypothetical protein
MTYSTDNKAYDGAVATWAAQGIIMGRSDFFFTTALIHEHGHALDYFLRPKGPYDAFSDTYIWTDAVDADGYAMSAYGTTNYVENFAEVGRAVLLDKIYPGGLVAYSNHSTNLSHVDHQLDVFKKVAGDFYTPGGSCNLTEKFPFPTSLVNQPQAATSTSATIPTTKSTGSPTGGAGPSSPSKSFMFPIFLSKVV